MSTQEMNVNDYLDKIALNKNFRDRIKEFVDEYYEWDVIVLFYISLHIMNLVLLHFDESWKNTNNKTHQLRSKLLSRLQRQKRIPSNIKSCYDFLYLLSLQARYKKNFRRNAYHHAATLKCFKYILDFFLKFKDEHMSLENIESADSLVERIFKELEEFNQQIL